MFVNKQASQVVKSEQDVTTPPRKGLFAQIAPFIGLTGLFGQIGPGVLMFHNPVIELSSALAHHTH